MTTYRTAESVCKGHPDKLCDLIADNISWMLVSERTELLV